MVRSLAPFVLAILSIVSVCSAAPVRSPLAFGGDALLSVMDCPPGDLTGTRCAAYEGSYQSVRGIDFRSWSVHRLFDPSKDVRLTNGHWEDAQERLALTEVHYLTTPDSTAEYVLLAFSEEWTETNPHAEWIAQVLEFSKQQWRVIQEFSVGLSNPDHPHITHTFDESTKTLLLRFDHLNDALDCGTAGGCTARYVWNGKRFGTLSGSRGN